MGSTAFYNLPYQELSDPPDGPSLGRDLAEAVEAALQTNLTLGANLTIPGTLSVTGTLAAGSTINATSDVQVGGVSLGRGILGGKRYTTVTTLSAGISTTEAFTNMDSGSRSLLANRHYRIHVRLKAFASASGDQYYLRVRDTNLAGTQRSMFTLHCPSSVVAMYFDFFADYETSTAETKTWVITAARAGGTGTLTVACEGATNPCWVVVEDVGPSGRLTTV